MGLAQALNLIKAKVGEPKSELLLAVTPDRLELRVLFGEADLVGGNPVYIDFSTIDTTSPAGRSLDMPLLKAVGIKKGNSHRPAVFDCTAGFGEDAWLLASHGCKVWAAERHDVIRFMLEDTVLRSESTHKQIAKRIQVLPSDARNWMYKCRGADAIVLDPMFPLGRKAKERKPMRVLRLLAGDDNDAPAVLDAALAAGVHRVCVKRPLKAPVIANEKRPAPDVVYKGKAVRFDVYLNN
ncbi:MAG: class I SAM-dependent methyltransferase [Phycisphaeraceae bacterium]|nr:class I SAM-dependent methyltransferase [Phycisphaeraceae bacterium]